YARLLTSVVTSLRSFAKSCDHARHDGHPSAKMFPVSELPMYTTPFATVGDERSMALPVSNGVVTSAPVPALSSCTTPFVAAAYTTPFAADGEPVTAAPKFLRQTSTPSPARKA